MVNFYDNQDDLTAAKINFYQNYIEGYLIKILMGFGKCFIADLFCGAGKNGEKNGSPLVLIDKAKYILTTPKLKHPKIHILFNDENKNNIQNLEEELKKIERNKDIIFHVKKQKFLDILPEILKNFKSNDIPKFFFLDPYTYSNVKIDHLKKIMSLKNTEVLLFLPVFHSYRFASDMGMKKSHKTRIFLEGFTTRGVYDYKNENEGIDDFMKSVKDKLRQELSLDFVRPILLDSGSRKNALFLLTKSQEGMTLMNKIAIKKSEDGAGINVKNYRLRTLFGTRGTSKFKLFSIGLTNEIKQRGQMTNLEIIKFTATEEFLPKHAKDVLKDLKINNKIKVFDQFNNEVNQLTKFCIAEKPEKTSTFKYIS